MRINFALDITLPCALYGDKIYNGLRVIMIARGKLFFRPFELFFVNRFVLVIHFFILYTSLFTPVCKEKIR